MKITYKYYTPVVVIISLIASFLIIQAQPDRGRQLDGGKIRKLRNNLRPTLISQPHPGRNGMLTEREMKMARTCWKYFENNTQKKTGLVNAVNNYPSTTFWDIASYLGGLVSAYELTIIDKKEFDRRLEHIFKTFHNLDLFRNELPNKAYNAKTADKVNYSNKKGEIGYSALDLGRFLIWAKIIKERYPEHADRIDRFVYRWKFCNVIDSCGVMYGSGVQKDKSVHYLQEGRFGYEEYAANGFNLWGFNTRKASRLQPYTNRLIYDVEIPHDTRDPRIYHAHNYIVTESFVMYGIELNWDHPCDTLSNDMTHTRPIMADISDRIYQVQENRFNRTGIMTARSEHQLDQAPYFVYDAIYTDGYAWNTMTEDGKHVPQFAAVSNKAALGLWVLWDTPYTDSLFNYIYPHFDPKKGYYVGIYENGKDVKTFTCNANGIMLECLLYKVQGKIYRNGKRTSLWDRLVQKKDSSNNCAASRQSSCENLILPDDE